MERIVVRTDPGYTVQVGTGVLDNAGKEIAKVVPGRRAAILSDSNVMPLYAQALSRQLIAEGFSVATITFPAGEASKNPDTLLRVINELAALSLTRADVLVALGGGVTGDLGGLAASLYLRGIHCVQIPTSLLAMVDSSVGGKTAVNLEAGKNLLGTFFQPDLVLCDPTVLGTLPPEELANGWAEIIKYAFLKRDPLYDMLRGVTPGADLSPIIAECVRIKEALVAEDEFDRGNRALLNFGHTMGHAIERLTDFSIPHGRAVGVGMAMMTRAAVQSGLCSRDTLDVLLALLTRFGLESTTALGIPDLISASAHDKKSTGKKITVIVPRALGNCELRSLSYEELAGMMALGREIE